MQNNMKPFASIDDAARITGLSRFYIRRGVRAGEIQHIMVGKKYYINLPALFERLGLHWSSVMSETTPATHGLGQAIRK